MLNKLVTASLLTISVMVFLKTGKQLNNSSDLLIEPYRTALRSVQRVQIND